MSNSNEPNTDEQIAQLDQKLRAMNTSANQNSAYEAADPQDPLFAQHAEEYENHTRYAENNPADADPQKKDEEVPLPAQFQDEHARHSEQAEHMERTEKTERTKQTGQTGQTERAGQAETPGMAEKCFNVFSKLGLPLLMLFTLILCGQQFLFPRDFWFSEEVRYADIYMNMLSSNNFFSLTLNGHPYAETGPLYFILVWLLDAIPTINMPQAFFGSSILFAMLFVASTWILARGLGYSNKIAFTAGLILLSTFFLAGFTNYTRMDLLFAAFLNLSYVCFFRAWQKKSAPIWLIFAFLFLCFAALTSTLTAFILPLIASFFFFIWTGKYKRINSADGIIGFLLAILIIFAWFSYLYLQGDAEYISLIFEQQIMQKINPPHAYQSDPYWYYLAGLPLALFPWIFVILFASWGAWLKNSPQAFKNRRQENAGAWLFLLILTHLAVFSLLKNKSFSNLVTVAPFFAVLFAKSLLDFSKLRSKIFFGILSVLTVLSGIFFIVFEFHAYILEYLPNLWNLPGEIPAFIEVATKNTHFGLTVMGALFILLGILLWYVVKRQFTGGSILVYTIGAILALQPLNFLVAPQLGTILSTKNHAYQMAKTHKEENAVPAAYALYPDVFTYYYNEALNPETHSRATITQIENIEALTDFLLNNSKVVLAISESEFEKLPYKNEAAILDYKQWIENQYVILTLWNISSHKPALNTNSHNQLIENNILNNSDGLLTQEDKNAIIDPDTANSDAELENTEDYAKTDAAPEASFGTEEQNQAPTEEPETKTQDQTLVL